MRPSKLANDIAELKSSVSAMASQMEQLLAVVAKATAKPPEVRDPSIAGFCKRKGMSRSMYEKLRRANRAPRETAFGKRRTIGPAAEAEWDRAREAEAATITEQRRLSRANGESATL